MTLLRPLTLDDVDLFEPLLNQAEVREPFQWFGFVTTGGLRRRVTEQSTVTDAGGEMAIAGDDGSFLGEVTWFSVSYGPPPTSDCWELGILLLPEHRGMGHGSAAQLLLVDYLFAHTRVERIQACTDVDNAAEAAALVSAGFTLEGVLRRAQWRAGEFHDLKLFSRLRGEPIVNR